MSASSRWKFESLGEPFYWWVTASSMKDASELIFDAIPSIERKPTAWDLEAAREGYELAHPSHDRRSVYVLLAGFCLENLFKAEYMRRVEPSLAQGALPPELREHDLLALSARVGFEPKPDEREMLKLASEATVSWGRYPGGLRHDRGAMSPPDCFDLEDFRRAFEVVYWRLTAVITEGWV
jgi:hypothetical protein